MITTLAVSALLMASAAAPQQKPASRVPVDIGLIARIEPKFIIPRLVYGVRDEFSIQLTLDNPSRVPVEVAPECLGREPFKLRRMADHAILKARRIKLASSLTVPGGRSFSREFKFRKLYGQLKKLGRYRLSWSCGQWESPVYDLVIGGDYDPDKDRVAVVTTDLGVMELALLPERAPEHVRNFVLLAKAGFYNGMRFFQIVPGLEAVTGDPSGTGSGSWERQMAPEIDESIYPGKGLVAAQRRQTLMTSSSQFFILLKPAPGFRGKHTFFAYVRRGEDVLDKLASVPVSSGSGALPYVPLENVTIKTIEIREK